MTEGDAYRALRDSRPSYSADSVREMLRMASHPDAARVDLLQSLYHSRRATPLRDTITTTDIAEAVGRDDTERAALSEAFRGVDRDGDVWLQCAEIWLQIIGATTKKGQQP